MSQKLVNKLIVDIKEARKSKISDTTKTLTTIFSEAKSIALKHNRKELIDSDILASCVLNLKEANEVIEIYKNLDGKIANDNYLRGIRLKNFSEKYLPQQLTEAEIIYKIAKIISNINASTMRDMGKVMKQFKDENPDGTYDTKLVSKYVKSKLS